jgi:glucose-6-phosphate isomerase
LATDANTGSDVDNDWGVVVISKSGGTLETAVSFRLFLDALAAEGKSDRLADFVVPVTGHSGKLFDLAQAIGCQEKFYVPDGVGGRFSIFSAVGLLPAAILGIDIVRLLQGAAAMNEHFRTAPVGENVVLNYVGVCHLLEEFRDVDLRVLSVWAKSLESAGLWYDQLLAESLGKHEMGATPLTVVNTRDLHSRAQQHQEGTRDKLMTNVIVDTWRRSPAVIPESQNDHDDLNRLAGKTVPDIMSAAIAGTNQAYRDDRRPTADIRLPAVDEAALGQFFQMMMLATVVEGRLMGINPYGQPGVEAYKRNMARNLSSG